MSKELEALHSFDHWIQVEFADQFKIIENALIDKELQDVVLKVLKEVVSFAKVLPRIEPNKENGFDIVSAVGIRIQRDIENEERKQLRDWILKTCFPKELVVLDIIKENIGLKMSIDEDSGDEDTACLYVPLDKDNICIVGYVKGKEKIDLLKEVLK